MSQRSAQAGHEPRIADVQYLCGEWAEHGSRRLHYRVDLDGETLYVTARVSRYELIDLQSSGCLMPGTTGDDDLDVRMYEQVEEDLATARLATDLAPRRRRS